jgi:hypothetical protein
MAECLHKQVVSCSMYLVLSCDEVTVIDNQSWVLIHCYIVQDWCWLHILIFLEHVTEGGRQTIWLKLSLKPSKKQRGVSNENVTKLMSCGVDGVNVF